jgi:PAS domain S-box-containing protein
MRQEEERLLRERLQTVHFESRMARLVLGMVYAVALAAVALTGVSVLREMERRARIEEQLQAAQKQFRLLFDSNPIPVWVYDLETLAIVDVNATAVSRYGYSREEFLRFKITDIRPPEDVPSLMDSVRRENESAEETGPWRHRKKSGEIIVVQIRSYPLQFCGRSTRLVVATDITEKKRAEDALKESEERLRMIVTNIKDYAVITLDPAGLVTSWNGACRTHQGIPNRGDHGEARIHFLSAGGSCDWKTNHRAGDGKKVEGVSKKMDGAFGKTVRNSGPTLS